MKCFHTSDVEIFAWDGEPAEVLQGSQRCNRNGESRNSIVAFAYVRDATTSSTLSAHYRKARYLVKPLGVFVKDYLRSRNDLFLSNDSLTKAEQPPSVVERGPVAVELSGTRTSVNFSVSNYGTTASGFSDAWLATVAQAAPSPPPQPLQPRLLQSLQQGQQQQEEQMQHQDQQWEQRQQWQQQPQWQPSDDVEPLFELSTHSRSSHRDSAPDGDLLLSKLHLLKSEPLLLPLSSSLPFTSAATSAVFATTATTATAAVAESLAYQVAGPAALVSALAPVPASMAPVEQLLHTGHGTSTSISATTFLLRTGDRPRALPHTACSDPAALMVQNCLTSTGTSRLAECILPPSPSKVGQRVEQLRLHHHHHQQQWQQWQQQHQNQQQEQGQEQMQLLHGQGRVVLEAQTRLDDLEAPALAAVSKNDLRPSRGLLCGSSNILLGGSNLQNQDINPIGSGDGSIAAASVPPDGGLSCIAPAGPTVLTNCRYNDSSKLADETPSSAHLLMVSAAMTTATSAAATASAGGENGVIAAFPPHQALLLRESLLRRERVTMELLAGTQVKEEPVQAALGAATAWGIEGLSGLPAGPAAESVGTGPTAFATEPVMRWSAGTSSSSRLDLDLFSGLDNSRGLSPAAAAATGGWTGTGIMSTHRGGGGGGVSGGESLLARELLQQQQQQQQQGQQHDLHLPPPPPLQYQQIQQQPSRVHEYTAVQRRLPVLLDATHSGSYEGSAAGFPGPIRRLASAPTAAGTKGAFTPQQSVAATARFQPYACGRYFPTPASSPPGGDPGSSRLGGGSHQQQQQQAVPAGLHFIMPPAAVAQPPLPQP